MYSFCIVLLCVSFVHNSLAGVTIPSSNLVKKSETQLNTITENSISVSSDGSCSCGVFLTGQFIRGSSKPPTGSPPILYELEDSFQCNSAGMKKCTTKCLESLATYLTAGSAKMICTGVDREVVRERPYLFVKNCNNDWTSTRMSAGREYCCNSEGASIPCSKTSV